ncbi:MAG: hypothetical protein ABI634_20135 [Acidobacteriota bacterium]
MKRLGVVVGGLLMAAFVTAAAMTAAADVTGRWKTEFPGPGGSTAVEVLNLTVKGETVTGTFANAVGGVSPVQDGRWDGKTLRFWIPWDAGRLEAVGTLIGERLSLQEKTSQWAATRTFTRVVAK